MNPYDQAHMLARALQESDEYVAYKDAKDRAFATEQNRVLLTDYKKKQFQAQAAMLSGEQVDEGLLEEIKQLGNILQFNAEVTNFMQAEYRINQMISDIFRIIGDAVDLDLEFLKAESE